MKIEHKNAIKLSMIWVLTDSKYGVLQYADNKKVIQDVANAIEQDMVTPVSEKKWAQLRKNANAAIKLCFINQTFRGHMAAYETAVYATRFTNYADTATSACKAYSFENSETEWLTEATNKINELFKNSK